MSDIYFIPQRLHCPECKEPLGSPLELTRMGRLWCIRCAIWRLPMEFGKQFAVIKDVSDAPNTTSE